MSHHDTSHITILHLRARLAFMHAAHAAEVAAAQYEMDWRDASPAMSKCVPAMMRGQAQYARARAAEHPPFTLVALKPRGENLN